MNPDSIPPAEQLATDALYHLATATEWAAYQEAGVIEPASLAAEGFVHCSRGHQVPGTVSRHFAETSDLLALLVDPAGLGGVAVVEEDSYGSGQTFPHAYGAIPVLAVRDVVPIT